MNPRQLHKLELYRRARGKPVTEDLVEEMNDPIFLKRIVQIMGLAIVVAPVRLVTKELAICAVHCTPEVLKHLPTLFKYDRDIVRAACLVDPLCIKHVNSYFILDDVDLFREITAINGRCIFYASTRVKATREVALAAVTNCGEALQLLPMEWCDTWEIVVTALKTAPRMFKYASHRITDTEVLALEALRYSPDAFVHASHRLQHSAAFVVEAVRLSPNVLMHVPEEFRRNERIITPAVTSNPWLLFQLPHCRAVLRDAQVLLQTVERDAAVLQFAPESMRDDEIIGLAAVSKQASTYFHLSPRLKRQRNIVLAAILNCAEYITEIPEHFLTDEDIVFAAVRGFGTHVQHLPAHVVTKAVALAAVESTGLALAFMPQWSDDDDVAADAIMQNCSALMHASDRISQRRSIVLKSTARDWRTVKYIDETFRADREIAALAIAQNGYALKWVDFHGDAELALLALKTAPKMFDELNASLVLNEEFLLRAIRVAPALLPRVPQTVPFWTAALAYVNFSFFEAITAEDYEKLHAAVTRAVAARAEGWVFLGIKTALDSHGKYSLRMKRLVVDYLGFPRANAWTDARLAHAHLLA